MSTTFTSLIDDCLLAIGDTGGATWSRADVIIPWAKEGMLAFPILNPSAYEETIAVEPKHDIKLPADFREVISVEYPANQEPPVFLTRMNRFDPDFYKTDDHFDVSRYYMDVDYYAGWMLKTSKLMDVDEVIIVQYLSNHNVGVADDSSDLITIPDEYVHIIVAYVVVKAYKERLSVYLQNPTIYTNLIYQLVMMVDRAETRYHQLVNEAITRLSESRTSPHMEVDKFDRIY